MAKTQTRLWGSKGALDDTSECLRLSSRGLQSPGSVQIRG